MLRDLCQTNPFFVVALLREAPTDIRRITSPPHLHGNEIREHSRRNPQSSDAFFALITTATHNTMLQ